MKPPPDQAVTLEVEIARHHAPLLAFAVVPAAAIAAWKLSATTTVEATLAGVALGRRSLKRWDAERWLLELRDAHLAAAGKRAGDRATLVLRRASTALPPELRRLLDAEPAARAAWERRTDAQRRMLREELLGLKTPAARERRARRALLEDARKPASAPARVRGLGAEPRGLRVRVEARGLPGRACGPYADVRVGLVQQARSAPAELVPGDARSARFETAIEVREKDGAPAFRGPAVHGPTKERFLYLSWIARKGGAQPAMFRRAKLRLDAIPAGVLARALSTGTLVGTLDLTAPDGTPVCASVRPPAIVWTAG